MLKRTIFLLAALVAAPAMGGPTPTPTPTPVAGSTIGGPWDACAHITPAAYSGTCGYFVRSTKPQNPTERYNFQWKGGSNACVFMWQSFDNGVTQSNLMGSTGCMTAGVPYSLPVCGNCVMGVSVATTPTPNASPISVIVTPSGDATIRVWRGTPTPTPTP